MRTLRRLAVTAVVGTALAGVASTSAVAEDSLGQHLAMCAYELGQRADAPAVTCTHDGMTTTFATFGAMVEHMREMH